MGQIKEDKELFSDGMQYHEESSPGDTSSFTFFNTIISATPDETIYNTEIAVDHTLRFSCQTNSSTRCSEVHIFVFKMCTRLE